MVLKIWTDKKTGKMSGSRFSSRTEIGLMVECHN